MSFQNLGLIWYMYLFFQPRSGIVLSLSDGTVTFADGEREKVATIDIDGTGFLELGTTFSVSLIEVQYLGPGGKPSYLVSC